MDSRAYCFEMIEDMTSRIVRSIARRLRFVASMLDGRNFIEERWHRSIVEATNKYVGETERYIYDLESVVDSDVVTSLSKKHGRSSTRELLDAGAWGGMNMNKKDTNRG